MRPARLLPLCLLPIAVACAGAQEGAIRSAPAAPESATESAPESAPAFASDRISVSVVGNGPDVVLIPGLGSSPDVWQGTVAAVPGYRYHLVHVNGFAGALPVANADGELIAPVAAEIARYIRTQTETPPALIGHSLGGTLAMMVAARNEGAASRVMVVDMVPFVGAMVVPGATAETIAPIAAMTRANLLNPDKTDAQRASEVRQTIAGMIKTEAMREPAIADSLASDRKVSAQAMYELMTTDLRPELANIEVPLTVLWVSPPSIPLNAEQMAQIYRQSFAQAPSAQLVQYHDSYHFIMQDSPERFHRDVSAFLRD